MGTISLIPFTREHIDKTYNWVMDPNLRRLFLMRDELTLEGHQAHFERILADLRQRIYAILAEGVHVGNCGLKHLSSLKRTGELWIYIGDPHMRRKGIGRQATELLVCMGFERMELSMIYVHVAEFNTAAIKLYKGLGFLEVPLREDEDEWSNRGCDIIRMEMNKWP